LTTDYCLKLANGQEWEFISTRNTEKWLDKLVSIMQLKPCEESEGFRLIFVRVDKDEVKKGKLKQITDDNIVYDFPETELDFGNKKLVQFWSHTDKSDIFCNIGFMSIHEKYIFQMWEICHLIYDYAKNSGGLPLHAGLVEKDGIGIAIVGRGGMGKSTCCQRIPLPWHALCDDEVFVVPNAYGQYMAHPFPTWSDHLSREATKTWDTQYSVPLRAIFFLDRHQEDQAFPIKQGNASVNIYESVQQVFKSDWLRMNQEALLATRKILFDNSYQLAKAIPAFKLRVSLIGRFWEVMEKALEIIQ